VNQESIRDVNVYNFPRDEDTSSMLRWMGSDYIEYILGSIEKNICSSIENTKLIAVKLQSKPDFKTSVNTFTRKVKHMTVILELQILVLNNNGHVRLNTITEYDMDYKAGSKSYRFNIISQENV
jgi:hypothetical protein